MKVILASYTHTGRKTLSEHIAHIARVSNPNNQNNDQTADKLIRYLIRHKHFSPFEMVNICLEIEVTRDIGRQILRHRSFSFQEFSQRYAVADLGWEFKERREQDSRNRQNSICINDPIKQSWWRDQQEKVVSIAEKVYLSAIADGIAKEQARAVLPEGITVSRMYMNGSLRSWIHYVQVRSEKGTQKEHRDVAIACANAIEPIFPIIKEFVSLEGVGS
jgi:thymidylate synthase (FAD)